MKKVAIALCLSMLFSITACGGISGIGFAGVDRSDAIKTFGTPLSPALAERGTPCYFNGSDYPYSHFKWAEYEDGSGKMSLTDKPFYLNKRFKMVYTSMADS